MIDIENVVINFDYTVPEIEDIARCLRTLYSTREGSQPLDRELGLDWGFVDKPLPVAKNEFTLEVLLKTKKYEPRVTVKEATFVYDEASGNMIPTVTLTREET